MTPTPTPNTLSPPPLDALWPSEVAVLRAWAEDYAAAMVAAERERCCRVVVVQRDDRMWDVARRTILAIRAGDDFFGDVDEDGLLRANVPMSEGAPR